MGCQFLQKVQRTVSCPSDDQIPATGFLAPDDRKVLAPLYFHINDVLTHFGKEIAVL